MIKFMMKKIMKILILVLVFAYIPIVCLVPQLSFLKEDIMAWIIYAICALIVIFLLSMFKEHKTSGTSGGTKDTEEILKERSKWYM